MSKSLIITVVVAISCALLATWFYARIAGGTAIAQSTQPAVKTAALTHNVKDIDGNDYDLTQLKGKVVLVVNVASKCGFTKQYPALEALYEKHKDAGLVIVGFPANNFNGQEPGSNEEIKEVCTAKYGVTFPMMAKISVKGDDIHPVYKDLTVNTGPFAGDIGWNFNKFLIARDGQTILARFASDVKPTDAKLTEAVDAALAKK